MDWICLKKNNTVPSYWVPILFSAVKIQTSLCARLEFRVQLEITTLAFLVAPGMEPRGYLAQLPEQT